MDKEKQAKAMKDWYWNNPQKRALFWLMFNDARRHETAFISPQANNRFYTLGKKSFFDGQMKARFVDSRFHEYNYFRSLEYVPLTRSLGHVIVQNDLRKHWEPYGADLLIDLDMKGKDIEKVARKTKKEASKILKYLCKLNVPLLCSFSGRQGFHIKIESDTLTPKFSYDMEDLKKLAGFICKKAKVNVKPSKTKTWADLSVIHIRGLVRVLNSLHPKSLRVALPLTKKQFEDFDINITDPYYIMNKRNIDLTNRRPIWNINGDVNKLYDEFNKHNGGQFV